MRIGPGLMAVLMSSAIGLSSATAQFIQPGVTAQTVRLQQIANIQTLGLDIKSSGATDANRLFVVGQNGSIRVVENSSLLSTPFLSFSTAGISLSGGGERGLLGMAFHPGYHDSGSAGFRKLYTFSSEPHGGAPTPTFNHPELVVSGGGDHNSVIREWTADSSNPNLVDAGAGSRVLMRIRQPQSNHNGGALAFGPDGYLYISLGDGGGSNDANGSISSTIDGHTNASGGGPHGNAQDITNVYGSILRIKPTTNVDGSTSPSANGEYRVPNSNPFSGATPGVDEIFAYGLRNPFRMSFDRLTGDLWAGDVGQGTREEVDKIVLGGNYGWVTKEGTTHHFPAYPTAGMIDPIGEYSSAEGHSVIGGFIYRGSLIPFLQGQYIFADAFGPSFAAGRLLVMDPSTGIIRDLLIDPTGDSIPGPLYSFGEDRNGELYAVFGAGQVLSILNLVGAEIEPSAASVPEPSTIMLFAMAIFWGGARHIAKRRVNFHVD